MNIIKNRYLYFPDLPAGHHPGYRLYGPALDDHGRGPPGPGD